MRNALDRYLLWGFMGAIVVHTGALAAGSRLSAVRPGNDSLEQIQVFDSRAPMVVSPVALVEWPAAEPEPEATTLVSPEPPPEMVVEPVTRPSPPKPPAQNRKSDPKVSSRTPRPDPPDLSPTPDVPPAPSPPAPQQTPAQSPGGSKAPGPADRGDGGSVDLGSPSPNGDLIGLPSGGTPPGSLPGVGGGSGPGTASGDEPGSGTGSGDGTGRGQGDGSGDGASAGGGSPAGGGGFISRVADRKQPEVIYRGTLSYPPAAVEEGVEGTVKLKVLVTPCRTGSRAACSV